MVKNPIPPEAELVLRLCRPRPSSADLSRAGDLLERDLDWGLVVDHSTRHRVLPAVWTHAFRLVPGQIDRVHCHLARAVISYNTLRARAAQREFRSLRDAFAERRIAALPRKGTYLGWAVYPAPSWRFMEDMDFLIRKSDRARAKGLMYELGYTQGAATGDDSRVERLSRTTEAFWLLNTSSLPAFHKTTDDPLSSTVHVDLRHHILEPAARKTFDIEEWFDRGREGRLLGERAPMLSPEDFFIDLCVHLHREAVTLTAIESKKDLLLARFVDVAEFLAAEKDLDHRKLLSSIRRYQLDQEIYFALRHTQDLLPGSVDEQLLTELHPEDSSFLHRYGDLDDLPGNWPDPIGVRIFDYQRHSRVEARSKLPR